MPMVQSPNAPVYLETHCLFGELDRAITALFELPGVPITYSQINRAVETVKRMCNTQDTGAILHFQAKYSPQEGYMLIYQRVKGRANSLPVWGIKNLPVHD